MSKGLCIRANCKDPLDEDGEPLFKGDLGAGEALQPIRETNANSNVHQSFVYFIMRGDTVTGVRKIVVDTPKTEGAFSSAQNEVTIYTALKQRPNWKQHILPFRRSQKGPRTIVLDFDYVAGHDLLDFIRKEGPSKKELAAVLEDIKAALAFCHRANVLHGDIKPDNFYVERGTKKGYIFDFGEGYMEDDIDHSFLQEEDRAMQRMVDRLLAHGKGGARRSAVTRRVRAAKRKLSRKYKKGRR